MISHPLMIRCFLFREWFFYYGDMVMKLKLFLIVICLMLVSLFACSNEEQIKDDTKSAISEIPRITIMTHDSFSISKKIITLFETKVHAKMIILKSGDAGEALNKAILSKNNPLADIFYGVDNTFLSRALGAQMFVAYAPSNLDSVDSALKLDPENRMIPVDFGDVCLNYDIKWFKDNNKRPPAMLEDIIFPLCYG